LSFSSGTFLKYCIKKYNYRSNLAENFIGIWYGAKLMDNVKIRKKIIEETKQVVIKVGTRLLTDEKMISVLISQIAQLREKGYKVLLVSSGAVGIGIKTLGLDSRPTRLREIQALAALGQNKLMAMYEKECNKYNFHSAQLLLTAEDLTDRKRHLNVMNCVDALWSQGVLPIINENDSVSIDELKFGDNDTLAALVATMTRSELTIILTTIDGLHHKADGVFGDRISSVSAISNEMKGMATGTDDSTMSVGGMISKLNAAEIVNAAGAYMWILDGRPETAILDALKADDIGTVFIPDDNTKLMQAKKRWLSFFSKVSGELKIDNGAEKAVVMNGKSLLPSGLIEIKGQFERGDTVDIVNCDGKVIAKGLINFSSNECDKIKGAQSQDIPKLLQINLDLIAVDDEIIHRDNMVIL
jgi:glutamate 5-kinase